MILSDQADQIMHGGGRIGYAGLPRFYGLRGDAEDRGKYFLREVQLFARPRYADFRKALFLAMVAALALPFS